MFERFTDRARRVVVLSQEEARGLQHNFIGTEHLLLGLLGETDSAAARVLLGCGLTLEGTRREVTAVVPAGSGPSWGHVPFTPRAKRVLELSLREALALDHDYIGPEHLLLGLLRVTEGVGAQIVGRVAGDQDVVRRAMLDAMPPPPAEQSGRRWLRRRRGGAEADAGPQAQLITTPAADLSLDQAARLAGAQPVGTHHLLLAALADADSAAARALGGLGVDLDHARAALRRVDVTGTRDELPEEAGRRAMRLVVTQDRVTLEATDPVLIEAARAALEAVGGGDPAGTVRGDLPEAIRFRAVWLALNEALQDFRRRAPAASGEAPGEAPGEASDPPAQSGEAAS
jgi:ATP-dependent Clp protease ATP-binding subunit ClpC